MLDLRDVLYKTPMGADRREAILAYLEAYPDTEIPVNRKYSRKLSLDTDLTKMLKAGKLVRKRSGLYTTRSRTTYLCLKPSLA